MGESKLYNKTHVLEIMALSDVPMAVYSTEEMIIEAANDAMIKLWGKDSSVIGKSIDKALPELGDQPFKDIYLQVLRSGESYTATNMATELMMGDQLQLFYFDFTYKAVKDGLGKTYCVLNTASDVTHRYLNELALKASEIREQQLNEELNVINQQLALTVQELSTANSELRRSKSEIEKLYKMSQESEAQLKFAIDAGRLATWDLNPTTMEFSGNERLYRWFGLSPADQFPLKRATEVIIEKDRARVLAAIERALQYESGGRYDVIYTIAVPESNKLRTAHAKGRAVFDEHKRAIRFSGILLDISEQAEEEMRKNDFIGIVSHELKTPMTSIKGYLQILEREARKAENHFATRILTNTDKVVNKLVAMINSFLDVSRLEAGKLHLNKEVFDVFDLVRETTEDNLLLFTGRQIHLNECGGVKVFADKDKIRNVIINFLSNAAKYSPTDTSIDVSCEEQDGWARIIVSDQGKGIEAKDLGRIFEHYYRVDEDKAVSGFGIGLYLSAEIIKLHEGKIGVKSEPKKGSSFWFALPAVTD